jgi:hypothetical protein
MTKTQLFVLLAILVACERIATVSPDASLGASDDGGATVRKVHRFGSNPIRPPSNDAGVPIVWTIPNWYIDPLVGSDSDVCTNISHPCKSWHEVESRWDDPSPMFTVDVSVTYLSEPPSTELVSAHPRIGSSGSLTINAYRPNFVVASTTLADATAKVIGTPASPGHPWQIRASSDLTSFVGKRVHDTTHDSWFGIDSIVSGSGASAVLQISQPLALDDTMAALNAHGLEPPAVDAIAAGDAITVYSWPQVEVATVVDEPDVASGLAVRLLDLHLVAPAITLHGPVIIQDCEIESYITGGMSGPILGSRSIGYSFTGDTFYWIGGEFRGGVWAQGGGIVTAGAILSGATPGNEAMFVYENGDDFVISNAYAGGVVAAHSASGSIRIDSYHDTVYPPNGILWGPGSFSASYGGRIGTYGGAVNASQPQILRAQDAVLVPTIYLDTTTTATAVDLTTEPALIHAQRDLTAVNIDLPVNAGGFGRTAYGEQGSIFSVEWSPPDARPRPVIWSIANGGTGRDAGCPAGQALVGADGGGFACAAATGLAGEAGAPGQSAQIGDAGALCPAGGVSIWVGDAAPTFVCNGLPGANGTNGNAGATGATGSQGPAGISAMSLVATSFTQPPSGGTVTVSLDTSAWMVTPEYVVVAVGGLYQITAIPDYAHVTLRNTGVSGNLAPGNTVGAGNRVSPSGTPGADGATGATGATGPTGPAPSCSGMLYDFAGTPVCESYNNNTLLIGRGSSNIDNLGYGTAGQTLTSGGPGAAPTWQSFPCTLLATAYSQASATGNIAVGSGGSMTQVVGVTATIPSGALAIITFEGALVWTSQFSYAQYTAYFGIGNGSILLSGQRTMYGSGGTQTFVYKYKTNAGQVSGSVPFRGLVGNGDANGAVFRVDYSSITVEVVSQ